MVGTFVSAIVLAAFVILGWLTTLAAHRSKTHKVQRYSFAGFIGAALIWTLTNLMVDTAASAEAALAWAKMTLVGPILLVPLILLFSNYFPSHTKNRFFKYELYVALFIGMALLAFVPTSLNIRSANLVSGGVPNVEAGPMYNYFAVYFLGFFVRAILNLWLRLRGTHGVQRQQIIYVASGLTISLLLGVVTNLILVLFNITSYANTGPYSTLIFIILTYIAIGRLRLMDIRQLISRSLVFTILVAVVALAFTFTTYLTGLLFQNLTRADSVVINLIVSFVIVLGVDPLKRLLSEWTDRIFFQAQVDFTDLLKKVSDILSIELDVQRLVNSFNDIVAKSVKLRFCDILVLRNGNYVSLFSDKARSISFSGPLIEALINQREPIITDELRSRLSDVEGTDEAQKLEPLLKELDGLDAGLVAPMFRDSELRAMIVVGHKLSGAVFRQEEFNLFQVLAPQLAAALQKSQLYSEVQDYSANLQKKVEQATARLQEVNGLLETRNQRLDTLQKFANVILQSYRLEEMSQRIIDYIPGEIEGCDMSVLIMVDEQKRELYGRSISQPYNVARQIIRLLGTDLTKYRVPLTNRDNLLTKVVSEKKMQKTADLYDFLRPAIPKPLVWALQNVAGAMREAVAVPLTVRGQVTGILVFIFSAKRPPLTDEDYLLLQAVADQVGIALERTRVYDELEKLNDRLNEANHYLQQLDKAKSEFLSIASHQLRTPTTGIKGFLSMMLEGDYGNVTKEQREVLQTVYDSTNRLIRLVNVFLNVSRIESGRLQLARADVDMGQLAKIVVTELRPAAKAKGLALELQAPEKVPTVPVDSDKIRDVLVNLTDNAIKYTEHGSVTVRVVPRSMEVEVAVSDTGMGLSADEIKALFAKFSRGERVKIKESQGSGLGLFIAKKIIEAHAGKIWVTSPGPGKGTTFSFTLPTRPPKDDGAGLSTLPTDVGAKPK